MSKPTPLEPEYYSEPKSKKDRKNLEERGWRDLTREETTKYMELLKSSSTGKVDYELLLSMNVQGARIRYYKDHGLCLYFPKADSCLQFGTVESLFTAFKPEDLENLKRKSQLK